MTNTKWTGKKIEVWLNSFCIFAKWFVNSVHFTLNTHFLSAGIFDAEMSNQDSLGLGKLGTQAEKDRRLKKK